MKITVNAKGTWTWTNAPYKVCLLHGRIIRREETKNGHWESESLQMLLASKRILLPRHEERKANAIAFRRRTR
jgi:hypothetical protein